ncbi:hypothetical protein [Novosphingobium taihuense]|uniref:Putative membrane protein YgcG n=1 Tax=Novosphingobium taihuense TaxID=260085 RepID=A0A7W7AEQ0_9SPHN|nr:hypothetical protein [Novosphingobium taihuense]MBB4615658.1 putative membrane protein YgcG [Novosphingobium taihuense]TWH79590.1 hypothetical protein IQ25_03975 [Novosphingobium taihuense]
MRIEALRVGLLGAVLMVGGCVTDGGEMALGEATNRTLRAQIIDPAPVYEYADPTTSGVLAAAAIERYRTDKVKKPERVKTSDLSQGGGNGGGGGGNSGGGN